MRNKNFFKDVKNVEPQGLQGKIGGSPYLNNLLSLRIGVGTQIFAANYQGMWAGSDRFDTAPFSVTMAGHVKATSAEFPNLVTISIFKQAAIPTSTAVGDLWYDTDDGNKQYRAASVGADQITAGEWELVSTMGITVFAQDAIPTSIAVGDLWYDTNDNNKPYRAASVGADQITAGEWELLNDLRAADALLKAGSSQSLTGDILVGTGSNVKIDGANGRILINDGTYDRILIGYQSGGF